jgi:hypothetical protein
MAVRLRSRRSVLAAGTSVLAAGTVAVAAAGLTSGCSVLGPDKPVTIKPPDADALRAVAGESLDLASRYDDAIARTPDQADRLTAIRDAHREHAAAIGRSLDASVAPQPAPSASASGNGSSGLLKALQAAERAAAERATTACMSVESYYAPLIGAIAAARASHAEVLAS